MGYEAVIFDFDGVLLDSGNDGFEWAAEARRQRARELGYDASLGSKGFLFSSETLEEMKKKVEESPFTWTDYIKIEKAVAEKKVEMVRNGEMELFPAARKVLEEIDLPKAVVSNGFGDAVDEIVRETSIDKHLEFWTAPRLDEVERYHRIWKPETDMLDRAMKNLGTRDAIMVGDRGFDVKAARNAGISSILLNSYDEDIQIDVEPTYRVGELSQVLRVINSQH